MVKHPVQFSYADVIRPAGWQVDLLDHIFSVFIVKIAVFHTVPPVRFLLCRSVIVTLNLQVVEAYENFSICEGKISLSLHISCKAFVITGQQSYLLFRTLLK